MPVNRITNRIRENLGNRVFAVFLVACGVCLTALALGGLANTYSLKATDKSSDELLRIEPSRIAQSEERVFINGKCSSCATAGFVIERFLMDEQIIEGRIVVEIPKTITENLVDGIPGNKIVFYPDKDNPEVIDILDDFTDLEISLKFQFLTLNKNIETITIPLKELLSETGAATFSFPVSFPLYGEMIPYPNDWYRTDYQFFIELPTPIWYKSGANYYIMLPIQEFVSCGQQLRGYNIIMRKNSMPHESLGNLKLLIVRDNQTLRYVYSLASIPILLSILFAHSNFRKRKKNKNFSPTLLFEVAAVALAILPLRSILVPANILGLVRVDMMLMFGITLMVLVAVIAYAVDIWNADTTEHKQPNLFE